MAMSLTHLRIPITRLQGGLIRPLVGASVQIYLTGTTTLATLYGDLTGSTSKTNPLISDESGNIDCFIKTGIYDLQVTPKTGPVSTLVGYGIYGVKEVRIDYLKSTAETNNDVATLSGTTASFLGVLVAPAPAGPTKGFKISYAALGGATPDALTSIQQFGSTIFDVNSNKLWIYNGLSWVGVTLT